MPWQDQARDSVHPLRTLFDAAARGYSIKLDCGQCRRSAILSAHALWHHCRKRGLSDRLSDVAQHCVCKGCRQRGPVMDLVHEGPTDQSLRLPPLHEWKRELSRHR